MNRILERIFKNYKPNFDKLQKYGFTSVNSAYCYKVGIIDGQFSLNINVTTADIQTEVIDLATNEEYTLFLAEGAGGSFVGAVRTAYENVLTDIRNDCFDKCVFKNECSQEVINYVYRTYGDDLEFLWEKFDDNAIWRRKDNKKWYGAMLTVKGSKLGLNGNEIEEILDLRIEPERLAEVVNGKTIFEGYHMNKKHWITVLLDGSVPLDEITKLLDNSYVLAAKK